MSGLLQSYDRVSSPCPSDYGCCKCHDRPGGWQSGAGIGQPLHVLEKYQLTSFGPMRTTSPAQNVKTPRTISHKQTRTVFLMQVGEDLCKGPIEDTFDERMPVSSQCSCCWAGELGQRSEEGGVKSMDNIPGTVDSRKRDENAGGGWR